MKSPKKVLLIYEIVLILYLEIHFIHNERTCHSSAVENLRCISQPIKCFFYENRGNSSKHEVLYYFVHATL